MQKKRFLMVLSFFALITGIVVSIFNKPSIEGLDFLSGNFWRQVASGGISEASPKNDVDHQSKSGANCLARNNCDSISNRKSNAENSIERTDDGLGYIDTKKMSSNVKPVQGSNGIDQDDFNVGAMNESELPRVSEVNTLNSEAKPLPIDTSVVDRPIPVSETIVKFCVKQDHSRDVSAPLPCRYVFSHLKAMASEARDNLWAGDTESVLRDYVASLERYPGDIQIRTVECRQSLCLLEVASLYGELPCEEEQSKITKTYRLWGCLRQVANVERSDQSEKTIVTLVPFVHLTKFTSKYGNEADKGWFVNSIGNYSRFVKVKP